MSQNDHSRIMRGLLLGVSFLALDAIPALAQQAQLEEIVVTARKREENLFATPLSVSSLSDKELERANIRDIAELTAYTPGFYYTQQAAFQAMRISPALRFRGMNNGSGDPLLQQGGMFVDGVFLFGGVQSMSMDDVARVEVIKGPQSALFGRSTFSGAINFITREPGDHWAASATAGAESYGTYQFTGSVDGPLTDKLSVRVSGGRNVKGGHFTTTDGGKLGYESTNTLNAQVVFKPNDSFQLRVRRTDNWQDDSRGSVVNMNPSNPLLRNAPRICKTGSDPFWCGAVPTLSDSGVPFSALSVGTALRNAAYAASNNPNLLVDILHNTKGVNPLVVRGLPYFDSVPKLDHAGLAGKFRRMSFEVKYEFQNGMSFDADYVSSRMAALSASSSSGDGGEGWVISPNILTDESAEARVSTDPKERFSGLAGVSYFLQMGLGGLTGVGALPSASPVTRLVSYAEPVTFSGQGRVMSYGTFASLHYNLTDRISLDAEGRYQSDRITVSYGLTTQTSTVFKAFTPRFIASYKADNGLMVYASWAEGKLPGTVNSLTPLLFPAIQATLFAIPGYANTVGAETVKNTEIGVKQQTERWRYALAGYYLNWSNLKDSLTVVCPSNLCGPGLPGSSVGAVIPQHSNIYGLEAEVGLAITSAWDVNATFEYVRAKYDRYFQPLNLQLTGSQDASGKTIVGFPGAQGTLSTTYRGDINADWGWYTRGDAHYIGRNYVDETNQAWVGPSVTANIHIGAESSAFRVDLYSNNITNNKQWLGSTRAFQSVYTLGPARVAQASATVVLPRLRTFGIRVTARTN